jgi:hypothetical protein
MDPIRYEDYLIYMENSSYDCGDLLILKFIHMITSKVKTLDVYCCSYIEHIIGNNGFLYILCSSHWSTYDAVVLAFSPTEKKIHKNYTVLPCTGSQYLHIDKGMVYAVGDDVTYRITDSNLVRVSL